MARVRPHCEEQRDEAIQTPSASTVLDCVASLAMTKLTVEPLNETQFYDLAARRARALLQLSSSNQKRTRGRPGAVRTHGPPAEENAGGSHHRYEPDHPAFPARWVNGLYVVSPVNGLSCHRHPPDALASQSDVELHHHEFSASVAAPGPYDFVVRNDISRLAQKRLTSSRPPHPALDVRDDAYAPRMRRDDGYICIISEKTKVEFYAGAGWVA